MCNCQSAVVKDSPWDIFLKHWKDLKLDDLRPKQMVFFYNPAWPWYKLGEQEVQSKDGSLNYDAILQLDLYLSLPWQMVWNSLCQGLLSTPPRPQVWSSCRMLLLMPISLPPKWQPTPVFLPGESHGWRSQADYSPWGQKELDTTERLHFTHFSLSQILSISLFPVLPSLTPHLATSSSSPSPHWISFFRPGLPSWTPSTLSFPTTSLSSAGL